MKNEAERPTARELCRYRIGDPTLSEVRRKEIGEFTKQYPHNNASHERFEAHVDRLWRRLVKARVVVFGRYM